MAELVNYQQLVGIFMLFFFFWVIKEVLGTCEGLVNIGSGLRVGIEDQPEIKCFLRKMGPVKFCFFATLPHCCDDGRPWGWGGRDFWSAFRVGYFFPLCV